MLLDKNVIKKNFTKAIDTYELSADTHKVICRHLTEQLMRYSTDKIEIVFEVGSGIGLLTREIYQAIKPLRYIANDLFSYPNKSFENYCFLEGDAEVIEFPKQVDLIVSSSTIQWFNDFENFVLKAYHALNNGGILAISTFGPKNYQEIRTLLGHSLEYQSLDFHKQVLQKYFKVLHAEETLLYMQFSTPMDVLRHIKGIGANYFCQQPWSKGKLMQFSNFYIQNFASDKKTVKLSYHPLYFICQKQE